MSLLQVFSNYQGKKGLANTDKYAKTVTT